MRGLFDGEHGFRVVPEDAGRCRFEQFESFRGLLVAPILWKIEATTRTGFRVMNRALKAKAEPGSGEARGGPEVAKGPRCSSTWPRSSGFWRSPPR